MIKLKKFAEYDTILNWRKITWAIGVFERFSSIHNDIFGTRVADKQNLDLENNKYISSDSLAVSTGML